MSNSNNRFRVKKSDTKISTIEKKYNVDLGVRDDMKLGNYLEKMDLALCRNY